MIIVTATIPVVEPEFSFLMDTMKYDSFKKEFVLCDELPNLVKLTLEYSDLRCAGEAIDMIRRQYRTIHNSYKKYIDTEIMENL